MTTNPVDYAVYEETVARLRGVSDTYREATAGPRCDKKGIGFNRDPRFSAFKFDVSFDSWRGYFGNSGCSTVIHFGDVELVKRAFLRYLNRNYQAIFDAMADDLEAESEASRTTRVNELRAELERLTTKGG